ncbi:MAG: regulatory signaling modulator protein AmpE [Pseudomonadales bacterium]|nr:regulatory signaling modulator protein AmpE [Pseudomonadales bacterium]
MKLLVVIVAIIVLKLVDFRGLVHEDRWYHSYLKRWLSENEQSPNRQFILALLIPASLITLLVYWVENWLFGIVGLGLNVLILLYCFGRGDLSAQISDYLDKFRLNETQTAFERAMSAGFLPADQTIDDGISMNEEVLGGILHQEFMRLYLVLFWYLILGVFGSLFICFGLLFLQTNPEMKNSQHPVSRLISIVEWIPVRILVFTFGLVGQFENVYQAYKKSGTEPAFSESMAASRILLKSCGFAALGITADIATEEPNASNSDLYIQLVERVEEVQRLLFRSLVIWLAVLSALTLVS